MSSVELYEYQREAIKKLRPGAILVGGVGSGKSRTALAYYHDKICGGKIGNNHRGYRPPQIDVPLYIITTARKRDLCEWEKECMPFRLWNPTVDSWNNIKKYENVENAFFIFDEQRLVGRGVWVKTFLKISKKNKWILLTATPGDSWLDYAPVMVANGFYKNITEFNREHVVYDRFSKYPVVDRFENVEKLEKIKNSIIVPMVYEKKAVNLDLWEKVGYDDKLYNLTKKVRWNFEKDEPFKNIQELFYSLRKIVNSDERRLLCVERILKTHKKTIIFYNFDYELELLRYKLKSLEVPYSEWNGHKHEEILDGNKWVYLVQYSAGAEGWNCIKTDTIIFYSLNYSYKTMVQSAGRIDRLNTPYDELYYYHIFSDAPIDKAIRACLKRKCNFNESNYASKNGIEVLYIPSVEAKHQSLSAKIGF